MNYEEHPSSIQRLISLDPSRPISLNFQMLKISKADNDLIFNRLIQYPKIFENFEFKDIDFRLKFLENLVKDNSNRANSLSFNVTGKNIDNMKTYCEIIDKKYYISPLQLNYFLNPNAIKLKANFQIFNNRFSLNPNTVAKENQISLGIQLSHITQSAFKFKKSFYISNLSYLFNKYEFEVKCKVSDQDLDLRRSKQNNSVKFLLSRNFNERPFLFRENLNYDNLNKINFQYAHKFVTNRVDERNSSTEFLAQLPHEDVEKHFKLFYLKNTADLKERSVTSIKASTSLIFSLNSTYMKNKLFLRKFLIFDPLTLQLNIELGNIVNLKDDVQNLKVHERFYINNFRGIENPSYRIKSRDGAIGDSIGVNNYLMISKKIMFNKLPIFGSKGLLEKEWQINPFIHFNLLWTPESSHFLNLNENTQHLLNALRFSAGCGLSLISKIGAIEFYYNAFVEKSSNDVKREFSIRYGID